MAQIQLTASELEAKKGELQSLLKKYKQELQTLDTMVANLKSMWEGDASDALQRTYQGHHVRYTQAAQFIGAYINALETIIQTYRDTESSNVTIAEG